VVDRLHVVAVGVADERADVAGVILRPLAGCAVVGVARGERDPMELLDLRVGQDRKREVDVLRGRAPVGDEREGAVVRQTWNRVPRSSVTSSERTGATVSQKRRLPARSRTPSQRWSIGGRSDSRKPVHASTLFPSGARAEL
jgi:hypothetical protein